jgi:hypothetical protein
MPEFSGAGRALDRVVELSPERGCVAARAERFHSRTAMTGFSFAAIPPSRPA